MRHYVIRRSTPAGELWVSEPRRLGCADRFSESRWTTDKAKAFVWADLQSASRFVGSGMNPHHLACSIEEADAPVDQDPYAISDDPDAPGLVVETGRRPGKNKTRISYRGV